MAVFYDSAPWSFASEHICSLLEHPCSVSQYRELYGNDFILTYGIVAAYQTIIPLMVVLSATLYAAQDFDYVRNLSAVGLGLLFVPLAALAYHTNSFLVLTLAGIAPGLLTVVGCGCRLHQLRRHRSSEAKGQVNANNINGESEGADRFNSGSVNQGLAEYRRGRDSQQRKARTQALAQGREADYRQRQRQDQEDDATRLHASLL